ncbi:hypothetical protein PR002_g32097 [Phytophthora rubi]|uniref:RxLR effector protein n=1 Tax=Phytophthora rubi TaxID=129364 RepID=A0A6A3G7D2_9STRA|nr:hypothetical protein PR002_g32097 [Phytophthora rubi]
MVSLTLLIMVSLSSTNEDSWFRKAAGLTSETREEKVFRASPPLMTEAPVRPRNVSGT